MCYKTLNFMKNNMEQNVSETRFNFKQNKFFIIMLFFINNKNSATCIYLLLTFLFISFKSPLFHEKYDML